MCNVNNENPVNDRRRQCYMSPLDWTKKSFVNRILRCWHKLTRQLDLNHGTLRCSMHTEKSNNENSSHSTVKLHHAGMSRRLNKALSRVQLLLLEWVRWGKTVRRSQRAQFVTTKCSLPCLVLSLIQNNNNVVRQTWQEWLIRSWARWLTSCI